MSNSPFVFVKLIVIATWISFVPEKMNLSELFVQKLQTISLVPSYWEYVE